MKKIDSISDSLIVLTALLFIGFYLCLSFFNRPASDDLAYISMTKGHTLFSYVSEIFNTWSGRWTSCSYFFAVVSFSNLFEHIHFYIFTYYIFTLLILSYSTSILTKVLIKKLFSVTINNKTAFVYGTLFTASLFYFTIDHIEVWWWLSASFGYLQGIVFLLFGIAILTRIKKNIVHYLLISLSFIYVGACFEIYALILFCLFGLIGIYYLKNKQSDSFKANYKSYTKAIVVAFLSFCFSAGICFSAPGNTNRQKNVFSLEISKSESISLSPSLQKKYVLALGISSLFMLLGMKIKKETNQLVDFKKAMLFAGIPLIISIIVTCLFQFFILKDFAMPLRGWTFTSFSIALFFCVIFLSVGYSIQTKFAKMSSLIKIVFPLFVASVLLIVLAKQYNYTSKYASAYDELIIQLTEAKKNKTTNTVFVKELPASGMLTPLNIADDYDKNPLKNILGLEFEISTEK